MSDLHGDGWKVLAGSCLDRLPELADESVDAVVCDPPYELGFMGKSWDSSGIAYDVNVWKECLRVLKPGGHVLAFGGSRTWHRLAVAVEDAGFELRDSIAWLYGSGFPKSLDVSKAIDKASGFEGEVIGIETVDIGMQGGSMHAGRETKLAEREIKTLSPEAQKWAGWGTALKPAFEPVVVGRKPLKGTVAANVLAYGVGGLNIDATRIGTETVTINTFDNGAKPFGDAVGEPFSSRQSQGRWPSNVILDEYTAELVDQQSGISKDGVAVGKNRNSSKTNGGMFGFPQDERTVGFDGSGGASRFFYIAKANKRDRNEGLHHLEKKNAAQMTGRAEGSAGLVMRNEDGSEKANAYAGTTGAPRQNFHPTVKPTDLMRQLIRLVTPPGGTVLDPFTGSGSTGKAAILEGMQFIGCELTDDYLPIIEGRINYAVNQRREAEEAKAQDIGLFDIEELTA